MMSPYGIFNIPQFEKTGFTVDDFEKPEQSSQVVNGIKYDTVEFKTNIYPDHLGDLPIGPVQIQGNVLYKTGQNNPFNQDNNFFGADIFNNFFDSYATRPVTVTSQAIHLHVSPFRRRIVRRIFPGPSANLIFKRVFLLYRSRPGIL